MFKIFGVNFLNTRNFGMARLCLQATNYLFFIIQSGNSNFIDILCSLSDFSLKFVKNLIGS